MENPFRYGEVVNGSYFAARAAEKRALALDLRSGQSVLILAPRRYGKTSLVLETLGEMRDAGQVLFAYVDLLRAPSFERLPDVLATAIGAMLPPAERALQRIGEWFRDLPLRPKFGLDRDGSPTVELTPGTRGDAEKAVEALLELPARIARGRDRRAVVVLDEVQAAAELAPHLPATMRSIFQHQADVAHVYLGSRRHVVQQMFGEATRPFYRSAKTLTLGPIPRADFAPFVAERFASTKTSIDPAAIERVLDLTGGHPSDTQELCSFLWAGAQAARTFPLPPAAVDDALERVLDAEHARFLALWEQLRPSQRAVLAACAAEPGGRVYARDFRERHRLGDPTGIKKAVERLVDLDLLEPLPGREAAYRTTETFLPHWLRRIGVAA